MTSIAPIPSQAVITALAALSGGSPDDGSRPKTPARAPAQARKKATTDSRARPFGVIAPDAPRGQQIDIKV